MISPFSARQRALPDRLPTGKARTREHDVGHEILRRTVADRTPRLLPQRRPPREMLHVDTS